MFGPEKLADVETFKRLATEEHDLEESQQGDDPTGKDVGNCKAHRMRTIRVIARLRALGFVQNIWGVPEKQPITGRKVGLRRADLARCGGLITRVPDRPADEPWARKKTGRVD